MESGAQGYPLVVFKLLKSTANRSLVNRHKLRFARAKKEVTQISEHICIILMLLTFEYIRENQRACVYLMSFSEIFRYSHQYPMVRESHSLPFEPCTTMTILGKRYVPEKEYIHMISSYITADWSNIE